MNQSLIPNILRLVVLFLLQILVFKSVDLSWGSFDYIHFYVYPLALILIPLNWPRAIVLLVAFFYGLGIDIFYDSFGMHAAASVFTVFIRTYFLKFLEPYEGYKIELSPSLSNLGFTWFFTYSSFLIFLHLLFYFSVDAFTFVFFFDIILNTIFSFIFSMIFVLIHQFISKTKY